MHFDRVAATLLCNSSIVIDRYPKQYSSEVLCSPYAKAQLAARRPAMDDEGRNVVEAYGVASGSCIARIVARSPVLCLSWCVGLSRSIHASDGDGTTPSEKWRSDASITRHTAGLKGPSYGSTIGRIAPSVELGKVSSMK